MTGLLGIFLYSMWHIYLPGESTPILFALGIVGSSRRTLVRFAIGLAVSNGAVMIIALILGIFISDQLDRYMNSISIYTMILGSAVFLMMGIYFFVKAIWLKDDDLGVDPDQITLIQKYPFRSGLVLGSVPSPMDLGFFMIGACLAKDVKIWLLMLVVWLAVIVSFSVTGYVISIIPFRKLILKYKKITRYLYLVAGLLLFSVSVYMGHSIWRDYFLK